MAIVSLIALLVALGLAAMVAFQPWGESSVAPHLSLDPGLGVALDDASPVVSGGQQQLAVDPARIANTDRRLAVDGAATGGVAPSERPGIAPARVVARVQPGSPRGGSPKAPAEVVPPPQSSPAPTPAAVPVAAPAAPSPPDPVTLPPSRPPGGGSLPPGPIKGGTGPIVPTDPVLAGEGDEQVLSFSFYIQPSVYRAPGEENAILQFRSGADESQTLGLQLWDDGSGFRRGLWGSGDAMGGERFLAPVAEGVWHEAAIAFRASSEGDGFYLLTLDGAPIDARAWVSLIAPDSVYAQVDVGLFREGAPVLGPPDAFFGPIRLSETLEPAIP